MTTFFQSHLSLAVLTFLSIRTHSLEMNSFLIILKFLTYISCLHESAKATSTFKLETNHPCGNNNKLPATILTMNTFNLKGQFCIYAEIELKENLTGPIAVKFLHIFHPHFI